MGHLIEPLRSAPVQQQVRVHYISSGADLSMDSSDELMADSSDELMASRERLFIALEECVNAGEREHALALNAQLRALEARAMENAAVMEACMLGVPARPVPFMDTPRRAPHMCDA